MAVTAKQALLALVNRDNQIELTATQVDFTQPLVNDDPATSGLRNTKVTLFGTEQAGLYRGSITLYYNRLPLSVIFDRAGFSRTIPTTSDQQTVADLVALINSAYGVQLVVTADTEGALGDILSPATPLPSRSEGEVSTFVLTAHPDSYGWTGTVELSLAYTSTDLNEVITQPTLDGMTQDDLTDAG